MSSQLHTIVDFVWLERLRDAPNAVPTLVAVAVALFTIVIYQVSKVVTAWVAS